MKNKSTGMVLVLSGLLFLILSLTTELPTTLKFILLGGSMVLNISGASLLFKSIKASS
jgi:hypothetical protein